ncbi:uncharacterized protein AB675_3555 [Cyphellophora attinorum]|uniref:Xylanolytic transcriptional activator regulatory domain-containing protein n=1 Tax=Cyphellophora attinorum TaxID=1664694 RepID=A0A0N0NLT8_9EURO|nr:uncharacterized protein AB675_3555 [Phialophora attinorum]KPI39681.1 hypothetical protein AB675_3555 [Phialophora attinorum]
MVSTQLHTPPPDESLPRQLPHPALPSGKYSIVCSELPQFARTLYLQVFWDSCHPSVPTFSERRFRELSQLPASTILDEYTSETCLVDAMLALGTQHCVSTGLFDRTLGLRKLASAQSKADPLLEVDWPGFEYWHRARDHIRATEDLGMIGAQALALMIFYLIRGGAVRDAYNLLGIAVRKAYMSSLHRLQDVEESGRDDLRLFWTTTFAMDVRCSLQLDMPQAIGATLVRPLLLGRDSLRFFRTDKWRATLSA